MSERDLFLAALQAEDAAQRCAYLDHACAGNAALRCRIEALLRDHVASGSLLDQPAPTGAYAHDPAARPPSDTPALTPPSEGPGNHIGPYKLLQQIGEGGMGTVFLAEQQQPVKRLVALKLIKRGMDSDQVLARFEAERQALALMDHPNIARVFDGGTSDTGRPFFVMELVKGVPLTRFCDERRLTPRQRLELFVSVCQAVQHAHQKGIIHRDLKPSNVLVALYDGQPVPKVIDFGVAKATGPKLTDKTLFTGFGSVVGTLEYMSPEQAELNQLDIDTRSDIYALGVLLYELLTGTTPLERKRLKGAAFLEALRLIREEEPPAPSTRLSSSDTLPTLSARRGSEPARLQRQVRGELDWIVMKCLEKDRTRRYETANGLGLDLLRYLHDEPVLAGPPSAAYRLRKFVKRNRGKVLAAALVLFALVAGIVGTSLGLIEAHNQREDAILARGQEARERDQAIRERDEKEKARLAEREQRKIAVGQKELADERLKEVLREQKRANTKAAISQAVTHFLLWDLLNQAALHRQMLDGEPRDPDLKVRTLLDLAARRIEGKFVGQEQTEAAVRLIIGETYFALGRHTDARPHIERAVQLRTAQLGENHEDTLNSVNSLAMLYESLSKFDKAEALFKQVIERLTADVGPDDIRTLTTRGNLATLYWRQHKPELAESTFEDIFKRWKARPRPEAGGLLLSMMTNRALLYLTQDKYAHIEKLCKEAIKEHAPAFGPDHPAILTLKFCMAQVYVSQKKYDQAEELYKTILAADLVQRGADDANTLLHKSRLADLYELQDKFHQAAPLRQEVYEIRKAKHGADDPRTLLSRANLALLCFFQGKYDQAEHHYRAVLDRSTARFGGDHLDTLTAKHNLATFYVRRGQFDRAAPLIAEVVQGRTAKLGADNPDSLVARGNAAYLLEKQGKYDQAEPLYLEVLKATLAKLGPHHESTLTAKHGLATVYRAWGKYALAEPLLIDVVAGRTKGLGADHRDTLTSKNSLATTYLKQKKLDRAEPLYKEVLTARTAKLRAGHIDTLLTMNDLATLYLARGQFTAAEPLLVEALRGWEAKRGANHPDTLIIKRNLAGAYGSQKKFGRAESMFKDILQIENLRLGPTHPNTLISKHNLAVLYILQRKYSQAEPLLEAVVAVWTVKLPVDHLDTLVARSRLASVYEEQGKYARSEPIVRAFAVYLKKKDGPDSPQYAGQLALLGLNLLRQKKHADAEPVLRDCLAIREKSAAKAWFTFNTQSMLGEALLGQKKYTDAEPLLLAGYEGMKQRAAQIPPQGQVRLTEALERLVRLYEANSRTDQAVVWRERLDAARGAKKPQP